MSDADSVDLLVKAASGLPIVARSEKERWTHLSLCVLDAVFSIGVRYTGVARVCRCYAKYAGLSSPLLTPPEAGMVIGTPLEQPLSSFVDDVRRVGPQRFAETVVRHRGRTSTRNGILKADAALRYAGVLIEHGVSTIGEAAALLVDQARTEAVEAELGRVPGHGSGIRVGYLWMLVGDDRHVKPDRMILRWLRRHIGQPVDVARARELLLATADRAGYTPWELDHAIWCSERKTR